MSFENITRSRATNKINLEDPDNGPDKENISQQSSKPPGASNTSRINPSNFVDFLPLAYKLLVQASDPSAKDVVVERLNMEQFIPAALQKNKYKSSQRLSSSLGEFKGPTNLSVDSTLHDNTRPEKSVFLKAVPSQSQNEDVINLQAYYEQQNLVTISIIGCTDIKRKLIRVIGLSVPYNESLFRITISKCRIDPSIVRELGTLLPQSNITEICLDDTKIKEGNYYVLLDIPSKLKRLSLNRCGIGNRVLQEILKRIDEVNFQSINILELSSNFITDKGAFMIANTLRRNRTIVHLNLSGNEITDKGAICILNSLQKFELTEKENIDRFLRKMAYIKKKKELFKNYYEMLDKQSCQVEKAVSVSTNVHKSGAKGNKNTHHVKAKHPVPHVKAKQNITAQAEQLANAILGQFTDAYSNDQFLIEDNRIKCIGNFKLCSLNLAYNEIGHFFLVHLCSVLEYQYQTHLPKASVLTGLVRVVIEGNCLPESEHETYVIDSLLSKANAKNMKVK